MGDILLLKKSKKLGDADDIVMVDGILLKNSTDFIVNENLTILNDETRYTRIAHGTNH